MPKTYRFGEIIEIAPNCLLVVGKRTDLRKEASCGNVLLYKFLDTVYMFDTGATPFFKEQLFKALKQIGPFRRFFLFNSHGHIDHIANNNLFEEIACEEKHHYISKLDFNYLANPIAPYLHDLNQAAQFTHIRDNPSQIIFDIAKFYEPIEPSAKTAMLFEEKSPEKLYFGDRYFMGWNFENQVQVLYSGGHTPGSVMFYLPHLRLLYTGDEVSNYFPILLNSQPSYALETLHLINHILEHQLIHVLIGSYPEHIFLDIPDAVTYIEDLRTIQARFDHYMRFNIAAHEPHGATIEQVYQSLKAGVFVEYLPEWEVEAKLLILNKIRNLRCLYTPDQAEHTHFRLPPDLKI